jgi:SSS family solute:Na+ symporter
MGKSHFSLVCNRPNWKETHQVLMHLNEDSLLRPYRLRAVLPAVLAILTARPLLGKFNQAFQFIREYMGFFTPGIVVIFLLGLFWKRATENGALAAAVGSFVLSLALKLMWPSLPFMVRIEYVFFASLLLAVMVSLARAQPQQSSRISTAEVDYSTSGASALGSVGVICILAALYTIWW